MENGISSLITLLLRFNSSYAGCLCIALFAWSLRFFFYTIIDSYWWQVPIELLHGLTFGLMFPAASTYVAKVSPEGTTTTMQSLMQVRQRLPTKRQFQKRATRMFVVHCFYKMTAIMQTGNQSKQCMRTDH